MADQELQSWFKELPNKLQRELATRMQEIAEGLANDIRAAAPVKTGKLRDSIRVRRTRKTLTLYVTAGGPTTTREFSRTTRYEREVAVGQGDTQGIARGDAAGVSYDYVMAVEFGTQNAPAHPFFYSTYRARTAAVREEIEDAVAEVISKA